VILIYSNANLEPYPNSKICDVPPPPLPRDLEKFRAVHLRGDCWKYEEIRRICGKHEELCGKHEEI